MAESLFFARNDRLQQHNTRLSAKYICCTGLSAQASMVYCTAIVQFTVVQYGPMSVFGVISNPNSNPNHTNRIFGRISNNFYCPSALQVDTASLPRPSQPMRTSFGALPAAQAPRTRTGCETVCETVCETFCAVLSGVALFQLWFSKH